ncbi:long-chain fatty acid--CoA ligase [Bacillus pumilus]|uniref:AMP-binding protein n=1 Tax=Bacillus pumilus TaxID=1408 RepID=UPI000DCA4C00|nr:AMP-binding protein [Bacillus pumilus]RAU07932.1 long-chain fatty acid--CoA ligase [Bacillus pumilus]
MQSDKRWLLHYPNQIPHELTIPNETLQSYLFSSAEAAPEHTAIHFLGKNITYEQLQEDVLKLASHLMKIGVKKGDRVAIMLPNCPQSVISYYAVLIAGGIVVQTNPLYTEKELEYQMEDSGAKVLITLDLLYPKAYKMKALTRMEHLIVTKLQDYLPFPKNILFPIVQRRKNKMVIQVEKNDTIHHFAQIMKKSEGEQQIPALAFDPKEDIAVLQYTGGTTGLPKGVMLTHENILANTEMCASWMYKTIRGKERILGIIPFFHVYGMTTVLNLAVKEGHQMILLPRFDVADTLKTIEKQKPTLFPGAPTMYIALLHHPNIEKYDLSSISACLSGSAALPVEVKQSFEKLTGGRLVEGYGLSETSPVTHSNFLWGANKTGSIGCPWPNTDAGIYCEETGGLKEPYEHGEIIVKGPQIMKGYWNQPEETEAVLRDGWFFTGDIGYMDEDGFFYIVDRKKDVIIASGYNIYPREVEEALYEHELVQEVVVAGIPDPYRGETVKAFVVPKKGAYLTEDELDRFVRTRIASFKVPRVYEFKESLPKTAVGKILRRVLIEEEKRKHASSSETPADQSKT